MLLSSPARAVGESVVAPSNTSVAVNGSSLALSDDFSVSGFSESANLLTTVSLAGGTAATLSFPTTTGLTREFGYNSWTSVSSVSFTGNQASTNAALDAMTLSSGGTAGTATLSVSVQEKVANSFYFDGTGHLYEFVPGAISYMDARTAAGARTLNGLTGYLVTITSDAEHNFVLTKIQNAYNIWIALSDRATEGIWVLDPKDGHAEQGTVIWNGQAGGTVASGKYAKWCGGEPNNWGNNEDATVTKWNGGICWNDLVHNTLVGNVGGYVVEYDPTQNVNPVYSDSMDIEIFTRSIATPTNLAVTFSGTNANLTWTAPVAGNTPVERYAVSWSTDNFQSGFGIASNTTSATIPNLISGTQYWFRVRADNDTFSTYSSYTSSITSSFEESNTIVFSYNPTTV